MKEFLKSLLVDPDSGEPLTLNGNILKGKNDYLIVNDVPVMLTNREAVVSDHHQQNHSTFDYTEHYKADAENFDYFKPVESSLTGEEERRLHQYIIKNIPTKAELILDAGCGGGWMAEALLPTGKKLVSMDIAVSNPSKVLEKHPGKNHAAIVADVFHLPFAPDTFDCIIASEIIEHVYDPKLFIEKLLNVLKPGGKLIITTPYNEKIEYYLCIHCNRPTPKNAHLHSFTEVSFKKLTENLNIDISYKIFNNIYMYKIRLYPLVHFLPFSIWKTADNFFNSIFKKYFRLMVVITKNKKVQ
ncbi:hypothetical protein BH09BAC2_BH09BAC2_21060 [soil metagenome]